MAFHLVAIHGINAVGDIFQFGFGVEDSVGTTQDVADAVADSFTQKFTSTQGGGSFAGLFSSGVTFQKVSAYRRSKTPGGPADELAETALVALVGSGSTKALPPEAAACVSLLTGLPGRSNRGRMYLPALRVESLANNGTFNTTDVSVMSAWAAAFLGDVNTAARSAVIWSRKQAASKNITMVSVGNQVDVQRRRQNSLPETYTSTAVSQV